MNYVIFSSYTPPVYKCAGNIVFLEEIFRKPKTRNKILFTLDFDTFVPINNAQYFFGKFKIY